MERTTTLVITSIAAPNPVLAQYSRECDCHGMGFLVIGDTPSPADFSLPGCDFWSIGRQRALDVSLARLLPERHYSRKNLGYLIAIESGSKLIIETDDDNVPRESFWLPRDILGNGPVLTGNGWSNVYSYFTDKFIWPRGFPLEFVREAAPPVEKLTVAEAKCPIQQGLADDNPDVDAVYRMTLPLPHTFKREGSILLGRGSWCPFNSQNTAWFPEAFPLLYLPSYCSFRMTDIWRSLVAQRICWENEWPVLFHGPTVWQERNAHNLLKDFQDEIPGYLNNARICSVLENLDLKPGEDRIGENMRACYRAMIDMGIVGEAEGELLGAWLADLAHLCP
jgi:hypothetical protein